MNPPAAVGDTAANAAAATDWLDLTGRLSCCTACADLVASRKQVVVGDAPAGAELLLLSDGPNPYEDNTGRPLVGRSGHHLDFVMAEIGVLRRNVAALVVLKCRPGEGRMVERAEFERCRPWTMRQIEFIDPLLIVTLGQMATEWALGRGTTLSSVRGHLHLFGSRPLLPTFHPSSAIRVGRTGAPAMVLEQDLRYAAGLLPRLRALRSGATAGTQ
ncbi:MAG TPA: uracil-DNA glycosylase [Sporichthyaceae bacterium]|nr:uracil-DNA glycosylase [Sporichthyaceae bacterium]